MAGYYALCWECCELCSSLPGQDTVTNNVPVEPGRGTLFLQGVMGYCRLRTGVHAGAAVLHVRVLGPGDAGN